MKTIFLTILAVAFLAPVYGQQIADENFHPEIADPAYPYGAGPRILIDAAHHNFHTADGRYLAFAQLLRRDGYVVEGTDQPITPGLLNQCKVFVISNAISAQNVGNWVNPTYSAFTKKEIQAMKKWVAGGGALFLIADHMPMGGAAGELASAFGVTFHNGFAMDTSESGRRTPDLFSRSAGTLLKTPVTEGRNAEERVEKIAAFTGQVFEIPDEADPVYIMPDGFLQFLPDTAWMFRPNTTTQTVTGWPLGAMMEYKNGRVFFSGEAAMFAAQLAGQEQRPMGMNHPQARDNPQLLLNIIHWLDGLL